jgi:hypothetical protein
LFLLITRAIVATMRNTNPEKKCVHTIDETAKMKTREYALFEEPLPLFITTNAYRAIKKNTMPRLS